VGNEVYAGLTGAGIIVILLLVGISPQTDTVNQIEHKEITHIVHYSDSGSGNLQPMSTFISHLPTYAHVESTLLNGYQIIHALPAGDPSYASPGYCEVDGAWVNVSPGDWIYAEVWVKTGAYLGASDPSAGAKWGFDYLGQTPYGHGVIGYASDQQAGHPAAVQPNWNEVNWGSCNGFGYTINGAKNQVCTSGYVCRIPYGTDWTLLRWYFQVPSDLYHYVWLSPSGAYAGNPTYFATPFAIDQIVFWMAGYDAGDKYFSQPLMLLNPVVSDLEIPTISAPTLSNSSITLGGSVTASVTVSGTSGTPTNTVTFYVSNDGFQTATQLGGERTLYNGLATSDAYNPPVAGTYLIKAVYNGNNTYASATSTAATLTVVQDNPIPPPPAKYFYVRIHSSLDGSTEPPANNALYQYLVGSTATITESPFQNRTFKQWLVNGSVYSTATSLSIVGLWDVVYDVQPEFDVVNPNPSPTTWALTVATEGQGSVNVATGLISTLTQVLLATPLVGFIFKDWLIDGTTQLANPYTLTAAFGSSHLAVARFTPANTPVPFGNKSVGTMLETILTELKTAQVPDKDAIMNELRNLGY
jgi:hypothetical protein